VNQIVEVGFSVDHPVCVYVYVCTFVCTSV
jgi:hypothetical protein